MTTRDDGEYGILPRPLRPCELDNNIEWLDDEETVHRDKNGWITNQYWCFQVPKDAKEYNGDEDIKVCPLDKYQRNKLFSPKERAEFEGICKLSPNQLLTCYKYHPSECNKLSFMRMCRRCKYAYHVPMDVWKYFI